MLKNNGLIRPLPKREKYSIGFSCRRDRPSSLKGESSASSAQAYPLTGPDSRSKSPTAKRKKLATYMDSPAATNMPWLLADRRRAFHGLGIGRAHAIP